jgi:hypothetical protein
MKISGILIIFSLLIVGCSDSVLTRDRKILSDFDKRIDYLNQYSYSWPQFPITITFKGEDSAGIFWYSDYEAKVDKSPSIAFPYIATVTYNCSAIRRHFPKNHKLDRLVVAHVTTQLHYSDEDSKWEYVSSDVEPVAKEGEPFMVEIYTLGANLMPRSYPANARSSEVVKRELGEEVPSIWNASAGQFEGCFYTEDKKVLEFTARRKKQIYEATAAGNQCDASPTYITVE